MVIMHKKSLSNRLFFLCLEMPGYEQFCANGTNLFGGPTSILIIKRRDPVCRTEKHKQYLSTVNMH